MFALTIIAFMVISPLKSVSQKQTAQSGISIPEDVAKILKNSCTSCHDANSKGTAKLIWNFSVWDTYAVEKQEKKSNAICNAMTKGSMPPSGIKQSNPDKIPTKAQTEIICKWAASLAIK